MPGRNLPSWASKAGTRHGGVNPNLPSWANNGQSNPGGFVVASPKKKHGGGLLGNIEHAAHVVEHGTQTALRKTQSTVDSVGTGLYMLGKNEGQAISDDLHGRNKKTNKAEWRDLLHGHVIRMFQEPAKHHATAAARTVAGAEQAMGASFSESVKHPLRDPAATLLNATMVGSAGLTGIAKLGYVARVANAARVAETGKLVQEGSDAAKAAQAAGHTVVPLTQAEKTRLAAKVLSPTTKLPATERFLNVPKLETPNGEGPANLTHERVQIGTTSHGGLTRTFQKAHDVVAQKALDRGVMEPLAGGRQTRTARYAERRVAGSIAESARITRNVRAADVAKVTAAARNLDKGVSGRVGQMAMFLRSANVTGREASDYWKAQAAAGIGDRIKLGAGVGQLRTARLAKIAEAVDKRGLLKVGPDGNVAVDVGRFPKLHAADQAVRLAQHTRADIIKAHGLMEPEGMQKRLDLVGRKMLGENARPGQGFVTLKTSMAHQPQSPISRSRGNIIPLAKRLSIGRRATGAGVTKGLVPVSTSNAVARGLHDALRFVNSDELRGRVARVGSDVKRTKNDILVRDPAAEKAVTVPEDVKQMLGHAESAVTETNTDTLRAATRKLLEKHIPGLVDNYTADRAAEIGKRAPAGHKWVPKQLVPDDLTTATEARGKIEKGADTINSAVTSATVYLKLGHLPTRFLTNLSTNAVQGSLSPGELKTSVRLSHDLTDSQKLDLLAATGTHGYQALPHAGTGVVAKVATKGANLWARKVDAPFRLNAILYELRQIGVDTPEAINQAIRQLKDPVRSGMSASEISKLDGAVRRSNRAGIMYDGLSAAEKRHVARYVWFYPWTKGAARFAAHTAAEHPAKAVVGYQIGKQGANYRDSILGAAPSYEFNLTPYTGGAEPLTGNLSSFTPYTTVGDIAGLLAHPLSPKDGVFGQLNPYYSALATFVAEEMAGKKHAISDALNQAVQPTPEAQIFNAWRKPPTATRMFGATPLGIHDPHAASAASALLRALIGAGSPRPTRRSELARAARKHR